MSISFWQGTLVKLRAIEPSDWEHHFVWDKDSEMQRQVDRLFAPRSQEATRQWAEKMSLREVNDDTYFFEIENLAGEHVGVSVHTPVTHAMAHFSMASPFAANTGAKATLPRQSQWFCVTFLKNFATRK